MAAEELTIPIEHPRVEAVRGLIEVPRRPAAGVAVLLAHGAGLPMESPFLAAIAGGLAGRGFPVLRFDYPYAQRAAAEGRRLPPDRAPLLEAAHRAALAALRARHPGLAIVLGGKSMGARIASHLAAAGEDCAGLLCLGYPLHPAGEPGKLRSAHFPEVRVPALFLQGTRDRLCDLALLRRELERCGRAPRLVVIEGADHAFDVPKRTGLTRADVLARLAREAADWIEGGLA